MKTFRKVLSVVLVAVILMLPMTANAVILSGECGADYVHPNILGDIDWTLDTETGVLSIVGEGYMKQYFVFNSNRDDDLPWYNNVSDIKSLVISDGVKDIGSSTCFWAENLTEVIMPDSVESIGYCTFYNCSSLESIEFSKNIKAFEKYTFQGCSSLKSVDIPDGVTMISDGCFQGCSSLESVNFSENITHITDLAFSNCSSLENLVLPDKVEWLGFYSFQNCSSVKTVTIGENLEYIGQGAFLNCTGITDVYYAGSKEQWEQIEILDSNECLLNANIHFAKGGEEVDTPEEPDTPDNPAENCSCNCHAGGITNFFWKIINFFQKLFGKNKVCECGVKH